MSGDVRAEVAAVLAAHEYRAYGFDAEDWRWRCSCGDAYMLDDGPTAKPTDERMAAHRTHVADALMPLLARREAEAQAAGRAELGEHMAALAARSEQDVDQ